jgi:flagellar hook-length control protein FliK
MTLNALAASDASGTGTDDGTGAADGHDRAASATASTSSDASAMTNNLPGLVSHLAQAAPQATMERSISTPVSDRNWSGDVASQVKWMINERVQSATLKLSPEHLGPLEVHIDVQQSQVNVSFSAQHPDTRSALEQSMPALRQLMASGGLTLGQTSVQQENRSTPQYTPSASRGAISAVHSVDPVAVSSIRLPGLIDEYA